MPWRSQVHRGPARGERAGRRLQHTHDADSVVGAGARRLRTARDAHEVIQLRRERLHVGNPRDEDVTLPDRQRFTVRPVLRWALDTFVVDAKLLARLHIVEYHHLLRPDDRQLPLLVGIQPGQLYVRQHAYRRLTQQVQCHGYVVRTEAPQGVLVRSDLAQIHAQAIKIVDATQLPPLHQGPQPLDRGVEQQQVTGEDGNAALPRRASHRFGIACAQGKRLLHQARLPRLDTLQREPRVRRRGRGDDDGLHAADQVRSVGGDVHARVLAAQLLPPLGVRVAHRG